MAATQMDRSGFTLWLTGMSGSGKSTLANYIAQRLRGLGRQTELLDVEELEKYSLTVDLNASKEQRNADVRRLGYFARLLTRNGVITLVPTVSPYRESRDQNRREIVRFVEIFVDAPVEELIQRDSKGHYKKALAGDLPNFIGITEPYEPPNNPEIVVRTHLKTVEESAQEVFQTLLDLGYLKPAEVSQIVGQRARRRPVEKKKSGSRPARSARRATGPTPAGKRRVPRIAGKAHRPAKSGARRGKR
jgi:adenylylsulfate kinase